MAFSSRFSFWEQKIKEENKPESKSSDNDGLSSRAKSVPALDPGRGLYRATSPPAAAKTELIGRVRSPSPPKVRTPVKVPERFKSPEPPSKMSERFKSPEPPKASMSSRPVVNSEQEQNGIVGKSTIHASANGNIRGPDTSTSQANSADDQGLTRKKVVKVVRRVVRKVLPMEGEDTTVPSQTSKAVAVAKEIPEAVKTMPMPASASKTPGMSTFAFKHDGIKKEEKDDISRGLTNLMVRGRTREPRPRIRRDERQEKVELEMKSENKEEKVQTQEKKEEKTENKPLPKPEEVAPQPKTSASVTQEVKSQTSTVTASENSALPPPSSKFPHSKAKSLPTVVGFIPAPKPSPLSPPPGFIPAPRSVAATKPTPLNPPSKAAVAERPSPVPPPYQPSPICKSSPAVTAVSPRAPSRSSGPRSTPPGIIPVQHLAATKQEEAPLSPTEEAQRRLMRIFGAPVNHPAVN
ncbi:uncharacterized protein ACBR49_004286 [Aulostomus maculatus]